MKDTKLFYIGLFIISSSVISLEIISTRISSVIFVHNYAFIILSLAILGLGAGSVFSFFKLMTVDKSYFQHLFNKLLLLFALSIATFICATIVLSITNTFLFFLLLFLPFFFAGILYSQIFRHNADNSFKLYASDLSGAALGSVLPLFLLGKLGATNSLILISILVLLFSIFIKSYYSGKKEPVPYIFFLVAIVVLIINGSREFLGRVPIGNFPEKDFYYVYDNPGIRSYILDSRWSIYGRADLVGYSHQDVVRHLFIDGAAGTQMYRFNGDVKNPGKLLASLLLSHSTSIPFLFLSSEEKDTMLVIGPGGGKEILTGLLSGIKYIVGVEVNPEFVSIVKDQKAFNGGIYTDFSNVNIIIKEGRHFVKQTKDKYDLIVIALPSTEQLQNIDALAMNENYLLTKEAIRDYLRVLTPEGMMIFTLHNRWELLRLIVTVMYVYEESGVSHKDVINHLAIFDDQNTPTIVIKKLPFTKQQISEWAERRKKIPNIFPNLTFLPSEDLDIRDGNHNINDFLLKVSSGNLTLNEFVNNYPFDITPCKDDSPYFYKVSRKLPNEYMWLAFFLLTINIFLISILLVRFKKEVDKGYLKILRKLLTIIAAIGVGFMVLEVSLFQKLILYLGSSTISLSILLSSLLVGMGLGSFLGEKITPNRHFKRLRVISILIVLYGVILFSVAPYVLNNFLSYNQYIRICVVYAMILPLGLLLGVPFPTVIKFLRDNKYEKYVPWMYGISATSSVLGSVISYLISMASGFNLSFYLGLVLYGLVFVVLIKN